ncbi:unnamed protein product [Didymodactylos carnosus]|uniref:Uncharacterized protein n=1 Tax=Didymodactylos carnosus TaxID=1234261 RepID=A0A8S2FKC5_9BILA|nr:unnamed protein product [Didymodactylos carnosus]CAF4282688.1 unnamed protein product [Didymodactylos carnosus]
MTVKVFNQYCYTYAHCEFDIRQIVVEAYARDLSHFENVLNFGRNLPYIDYVAIAYTALFNEMKNHNHLNSFETSMIVYKINDAPIWSNYPRYGTDAENQFKKLKNDLPDGV